MSIKNHIYKIRQYIPNILKGYTVSMKKTAQKTVKHPKYIFVVGGVMSSVGKGIASASIGRILLNAGYTVDAIKIDPYINVDAGTMNPTEHGEVFVTYDGDETDQDIGNYERFLNRDIGRDNYMTTGRVYHSVINDERSLKYGGKCVQVVPHVPMEVIRRIKYAQQQSNTEIMMIEVGGTIGEYENILFMEAIRMMKQQSPADVITVMLSYVPIPSKVGEMKTKPTQHAVRLLNSTGIFPEFLLCRATEPLDHVRKEKLSLFCNVISEHIISAPDVHSIYTIPDNFEKQGLGKKIISALRLPEKSSNNTIKKSWQSFIHSTEKAKNEIHIGLVGKYFESGSFTLADSYISVIEALKYSCYQLGKKPVLSWINAEEFEKNPSKLKTLKQYDGILVPGGFGTRGVEGIITAIAYVRKNKIPYLGICYGMQLAAIEYARSVAKLSDAHTTEVSPKTKNPIIHIMPEQIKNIDIGKYGGNMRLGDYITHTKKDSLLQNIYGSSSITERHRHRYEFNNDYQDILSKKGLVFSGLSPDGHLVESIELPTSVHPFFVGVQYHPEFLARPLSPHPLFTAFIKASSKKK